MEIDSPDACPFSWTKPYQGSDVELEWIEVQKKLVDPKFHAITHSIFHDKPKPMQRSAAMKRGMDSQDDPSFAKRGKVESNFPSSKLSQNNLKEHNTNSGPSVLNDYVKGKDNLCKRVLAIKEKLQTVSPNIQESCKEKIRDLSDRAQYVYEWLENADPPSRSYIEKSASKVNSICGSTESHFKLHNSFVEDSKSQKTCDGFDLSDKMLLTKMVTPLFVNYVENIAIQGKEVKLTFSLSPHQILSDLTNKRNNVNEPKSVCNELEELDCTLNLPVHMNEIISTKSVHQEPCDKTQAHISQSSSSIHEREEHPHRNSLSSSFTVSTSNLSDLSPSEISESWEDYISESDGDFSPDSEESEDAPGSQIVTRSSNHLSKRNSVGSNYSISKVSTDSKLIHDCFSSNPLVMEQITDLELSKIFNLGQGSQAKDCVENDISKLNGKSESYVNTSAVPDSMTYVVSSVPVFSPDNQSKENFSSISVELHQVRARIACLKKTLFLILKNQLKEQLMGEVKVVITKLPDYIFEAHLKSKPIMIKNLLPLISDVKSVL